MSAEGHAEATAGFRSDTVHRYCGTCRFWNGPVDPAVGDRGDCRRSPPAAATNKWPSTAPDGWCGEWVIEDLSIELRSKIGRY
ncbi:MAG: hypothetical protein AB7P02_23980 [Alphaproteobacteria bacterium]